MMTPKEVGASWQTPRRTDGNDRTSKCKRLNATPQIQAKGAFISPRAFVFGEKTSRGSFRRTLNTQPIADIIHGRQERSTSHRELSGTFCRQARRDPVLYRINWLRVRRSHQLGFHLQRRILQQQRREIELAENEG
jgi:hypothetical protein